MSDAYEQVREYFLAVPGATVSSGKGAQGVKAGRKMFAMFYKGDLLLKLPADRVSELITAGEGQAYDPGTGSAMKDRVLIPSRHKARWVALCEESFRFVAPNG